MWKALLCIMVPVQAFYDKSTEQYVCMGKIDANSVSSKENVEYWMKLEYTLKRRDIKQPNNGCLFSPIAEPFPHFQNTN